MGTIMKKLQEVNAYYERPGSFRVEAFRQRSKRAQVDVGNNRRMRRLLRQEVIKEMEDRVGGRIMWIGLILL